jgi:hypothetical protein
MAVAASLLFALLALLVASHAATDGLCCADDAAISLAAKSLAGGEGYSLPLNFRGESGHFPMDAGISSGPTVVLPAALAIRLAGAQPWVPSLMSALLSLGLLALLAWRVHRDAAAGSANVFLLCAIPALYFITAGEFFVHWYALLGEASAWTLLGLAAWLVAGCLRGEPGAGWRRAFVAGLVAGLAIDAKLLALLGAIAIGIAFAWRLLRGELDALRQGIAYTAGFAAPPLLLELARYLVLGREGYWLWGVEMKAFMSQQGPAAGASLSTYWRALDHAMGWSPLVLLLPLLIVLSLRWRNPAARRLALASLLATAAALTNLAWWFLRSNGWPRYALIGLCLLAIAAAFAVAAQPADRRLLLLAAVLACLAPWQRLDRMQENLGYAIQNGFVENERLTALRAIARYIDRPELRGAMVTGYWWASIAPLEYASHGSHRTVAYNRLEKVYPPPSQTLLLDSPSWDAMASADTNLAYLAFHRQCSQTLVVVPPYTLRRCQFPATVQGSRR